MHTIINNINNNKISNIYYEKIKISKMILKKKLGGGGG